MNDDSPAKPIKPPLSDSPWLWFGLFAAVGLAALIATGGKFGRRQANIENKYQARTAVATGQMEVETRGGEQRATGAPEYSTPQAVSVPIWPLEILLAAACALCVVMLARQRLA